MDRDSTLDEILNYANRAVMELSAMQIRRVHQRDPSALTVLRSCHQIYLNLLKFNELMVLGPHQSHKLQNTIERLKIHLQRLGEDV